MSVIEVPYVGGIIIGSGDYRYFTASIVKSSTTVLGFL